MLGDAIEYPARGDDALTTILVGGFLPLLAILVAVVGLALSVVLVGLAVLPLAVVPTIALFGYYVAVLRAATAGEPEPPRFREWRRLLADGLRFIAVTVVYAVPLAALFGAFFGVVTIAGSVAGNRIGEVVVTLAAVLVGGLALGYLLVYAYVRPLALANAAREDRLGAAFDLDTLRAGSLSKAYAVAWLLATIVWLVGGTLRSSLAIVLLGFFLGFYADVVRWHLYGRGLQRALDRSSPEPATAATATTAEERTGRTTTRQRPIPRATIPEIEPPEAFEARTRAVDADRGWPDWETE